MTPYYISDTGSSSTNNKENINQVTAPSITTDITSFTFNSKFIAEVTQNTYGRFAKASCKRAFAILTQRDSGDWEVGYFNLANQANSELDRPLIDCTITVDQRGIPDSIRARTPTSHTSMHGNSDRSITFKLTRPSEKQTGIIFPTSPKKKGRSAQKMKILTKDDSSRDIKKSQVRVIGADVAYRSNSGKKRRCSQKKVMGNLSARSTMRMHGNNNEKDLTPEAADFLKKTNKAEWLHLIAHSLTPRSQDPQQRSNLGAALARDNTKMMIMENVAKLLSQCNDVNAKIDAEFRLLPNTDIIDKIQYELKLKHKKSSLILKQKTNVFSDYQHPVASDQMLLLVAISLLTGKKITYQQAKIESSLIANKENEKVASPTHSKKKQYDQNNSNSLCADFSELGIDYAAAPMPTAPPEFSPSALVLFQHNKNKKLEPPETASSDASLLI